MLTKQINRSRCVLPDKHTHQIGIRVRIRKYGIYLLHRQVRDCPHRIAALMDHTTRKCR